MATNFYYARRVEAPAPPATPQQDERVAEMDRLDDLGQAAELQGDAESALRYYDQALAIARELGDRTTEARLLYDQGLVAAERGDPGKTTEHFEQALAVVTETGNRTEQLGLLNLMGLVAKEFGWPDMPERYFNQMLAVAREANERAAEIDALFYLGEMARVHERPAEARSYYEQALTIAQKEHNRTAEGKALHWLVSVEDRLEQRVRLNEQALAASRESGDRQNEGVVLNSLAQGYTETGRYDEARRCLDQALLIAHEIDDPLFEAFSVLNSMGYLAVSQGNKKEAAGYFQQALDILEAIGADDWYKNAVRNNLANAKGFRWPWQH